MWLKQKRGQALVEIAIMIPLFIAVMIALFGICQESVLKTTTEDDFSFKKTKTIYITALGDNITTEGSFYLGTGRVKGEMRYFYIVKKDGGYKTENIPSDNAIIYEKQNLKNPRIELHKGKYKNNDFKKFFLFNYEKEVYKIYIPKGSIKTDYNIDLK